MILGRRIRNRAPKPSREAVRRDLRHLLLARDALRVPLIIGSCGMSGRDVGVDWVEEIAREIAAEEGLHFSLALIKSEQPVSTEARSLRLCRLADQTLSSRWLFVLRDCAAGECDLPRQHRSWSALLSGSPRWVTPSDEKS